MLAGVFATLLEKFLEVGPFACLYNRLLMSVIRMSGQLRMVGRIVVAEGQIGALKVVAIAQPDDQVFAELNSLADLQQFACGPAQFEA